DVCDPAARSRRQDHRGPGRRAVSRRLRTAPGLPRELRRAARWPLPDAAPTRRYARAADHRLVELEEHAVTSDTFEPIIRRATAADFDSLGRLGTLLVQEHYEFDQRGFLEPTPSTAMHYGGFLASQVDEPE